MCLCLCRLLSGEENDADASLHPEHQRGRSAVRGGQAFHPGGLVCLRLSLHLYLSTSVYHIRGRDWKWRMAEQLIVF